MCEIDKEAPVVILPDEVKSWLKRQMEVSPYAALGAAYNCAHLTWVKEMWEKRPEFFTSEEVSLAGDRWDRDGGWFKWETTGNGIEPPLPTEDFYESMHLLLAWYLMNNKGMPSKEVGALVRRTQYIVSALLPRKLANALIAYMNGPDFFATPEYQKLAQHLALMLNRRVANEDRLELIHQLCIVRFRTNREMAMALAWECARFEINNEMELFRMVPMIVDDPVKFVNYYYAHEPSLEGVGLPSNLLTRKMKFKMILLLFVQLTADWFRLRGDMRQDVLSLEKGLPIYLGFSPEEGEEWFAAIAEATAKLNLKPYH
jgi:hypothetical protein